MATTADKKPKKSEGVIPSDLDDLYEKIIGNQGRQYNQGTYHNDFRPAVVNLPTVPTAPVQTKFAGTQSYDNTPSMYIAPGYSQLKDLSIKRSNQAVSNSNAWDKTKANFLSNMPKIDDPDYLKAQEDFMQTMNGYEEKLKQGDWADQASMVSSFVDELVNKKGGKQFVGLNLSKEERRKLLEEKLGEYDPKSGTGGIDPTAVNYLSRPTYNPAVRDNEGNIIGGMTYNYPDAYDTRNIPKELNDFMSVAKGSITLGTPKKDENGNTVETYMDPTGILGKYGIVSNESYTKEQIAKAALNYLDSTNGDSYLAYQGRVREFNSPLSADDYREKLETLANQEGANPAYKQLLALTDDQLLAKAKELRLGEQLQTAALKRSVLNGAIAANEYDKQSVAFTDDDVLQAVEIARLTEPYKRTGKSGNESDNEFDENGNPTSEDLPYTFVVTDTGIYNAPDMYAPDAIASRVTAIDKENTSLNAQLGQLRQTDSNYENNPRFKSLVKQKEKLDTEMKYIKDIQGSTFKELSDVSMSANKIGLSTMVQFIQGQNINGRKLGLSTKDLATVLQNAVYAEIDNDSKTNAQEILNQYKIPSSFILSDNDVYNKSNDNFKSLFNKFKVTTEHITGGSPLTIGTTGTDKSVPPYLNLNSFVKNVADKYKEIRGTKDRQGRSTYDPKIETNQMIFRLNNDSQKYPEAKKYEHTLEEIAADVSQQTSAYKVHNPFGGQSKTLLRRLQEISGLDAEQVFQALKLKTVYLSSQQNFKGDKGLVYVANFDILNPSKVDHPDAYKAVEKVRVNLKGGTTLNIPIQLDRNNHKDNNVKNALLNLIKKNDLTSNGLDEVTRQQAFLTLSKMEGIDSAIDASYLYNLDGSGKNPARSERDMRINGTDIKVKAIDNPFGTTKEDKSFQLRVKQDGQYKYLAQDKFGNPQYVTDAQLKQDKDLTIRTFDTSEDIKAFFTEVKYRQEGKISNFNGGGSTNPKYGTDRPADKSRTYSVDVMRNGQAFKTNAYVPQENLVDLTGKIKIASNAGIPFVNKSIADPAIELAKRYGLTVSGGLRTKEHSPANSAERSSHFAGNSLDFKLDNNARKLYKDIQANPNLAQRLGIQFAHDGDHVHITFSSPQGTTRMQKSYANSSIMKAIAQGESSNQNLGYHYEDTNATSAYGKYGFQKDWINRMASYYNTTPEVIRKTPSLIDEYANTEYLKLARQETLPYYNQLKEKLERYIPNFSKEDAIFIYHYGGGARIKQLARGELTANSIPAPEHNSLTFRDYVLRKRKYLR